MAIAHRASASFSSPANPTTTATVVISSSVATGDDLYCVFTSRDHTSGTARATCTDDDSGGNTWTLVGESTDRKASIHWKKATSATASKTITIAGAVGSLAGGYTSYSGASSGDPTTDLVVETNASGDETHAGFTPTNANSMVLFAVFNYANDNAVTVLAAATLGTFEPERFERLSTGGSDCACIVGSVLQSGGPTGTGDFTWSQTNGTTYSAAWAMKAPAEGAPGSGVATATANDPSYLLQTNQASGIATATAPAPTILIKAPVLV